MLCHQCRIDILADEQHEAFSHEPPLDEWAKQPRTELPAPGSHRTDPNTKPKPDKRNITPNQRPRRPHLREVGRARRSEHSPAVRDTLLATLVILIAPALYATVSRQVPWVTYVAIAATAIISVRVLRNQTTAAGYLFDSELISVGERYRKIASMFVHADILHLLFNMLTLFFVGRALETTLANRFGIMGAVLFGAFYIAAQYAVATFNMVYARKQGPMVSVGASGAVLAVLAWFVALYPNARFIILIVPLPAWLYLTLFTSISAYALLKNSIVASHIISLGRGNVNHIAHLAGVFVGLLAGSLFLFAV